VDKQSRVFIDLACHDAALQRDYRRVERFN
jgi:hypothetical protein